MKTEENILDDDCGFSDSDIDAELESILDLYDIN